MASLFERLKADCASDWQDYTHHAFVEGMRRGDLPMAAFQDYLVQDYLFLIQFSRAYALSIYKSRSLSEMRNGLEGLKAIMDVEMDLHVRMCERWGLAEVDLEQVPEKTQTIAYTRFVLEAGNAGDLLDLYLNPQFLLFSSSVQTKVNIFWFIHRRSTLIGIDEEIQRAFDRYTFVRDSYLQNRQFLLYDGNPPEEDFGFDDEFDDFDDEEFDDEEF